MSKHYEFGTVHSQYGAPMGREPILPPSEHSDTKIHLERMHLVDGDYDNGGAYWGAPSCHAHTLWVAHNWLTEIVVRAESRDAAKAKVREILPTAKFYR